MLGLCWLSRLSHRPLVWSFAMLRLIPLSSLSAGRRNPRRVKPEREAHQRLVASIRSVGLISPLTVCPQPDDPDSFRVVAGKRRLEALRAVYRGSSDEPKIRCEVIDVDTATADAVSLAENFVREAMHPLDEAEAFAKLAHVEAKGVAAVASEFGVTDRYVRQRMKLAGLADEIKAAYRDGEIDTATAEVFSSVPASRQLEVWREVDGQIAHAHHAKNLIQTRWIDAKLARFDTTSLPDSAVSSDLFSECVLIDRQAFMIAQAEALSLEQEALLEDGWSEVLIAERSEVFDRLQSMTHPEPTYDAKTLGKLESISKKRDAFEEELAVLESDEDEEQADKIWQKIDSLNEKEDKLLESATPFYDEATRAHGCVFLLIDPDGRVHTEYRIPRMRGSNVGANGTSHSNKPLSVPTPEDLSDRQKSEVWVHETIAVRRALLDDAKRQKVLLVMMLHGTVQNNGLLIRSDADPIERYVELQSGEHGSGFSSPLWDELAAGRDKCDIFDDCAWLETPEAYPKLMALKDKQLDQLLSHLTVRAVSGALHHRSPLTAQIADELEIEVREHWLPTESWLKGYRKIQLAGLIGQLRGPAHGAAAERMKKSELVTSLATLFAKARAGELEDEALADRVNNWQPSCLCSDPDLEEVAHEEIESAAA